MLKKILALFLPIMSILATEGQPTMKTKFLIIHGNHGSTIQDNWFPYLKNELEKLGGEVIAKTFPDNQLARESEWIPFIEQQLEGSENVVIIGHSSGAIAAMRYAETHRILGSVLVAGYYTDLGIPQEKQSGYFDRPWNWDKIKKNQQWILQFSSTNDPWIPIGEPRFVHEKLNTEYFEFNDMGHFGGDYHKASFPELLEALKEKIFKVDPNL